MSAGRRAARGGVGALDFVLADRIDEPLLRRFAREQSMPGWISLGFEREPDFFHAADIEGDRHQVLLARDTDTGRVLAMHSRSVRDVFVDGRVRRLGYLGQLRTDARVPGGRWRYRLMREGFAAGRQLLRAGDELPYDLTAIVYENRPARRLLEAGLAGLPRYTPVATWSTLAFATGTTRRHRPGYRMRSATGEDLPAIVALLNRHNACFQFAPRWRVDDLHARRCRDLDAGDFLLAERGGEPVGCIAVWDQRRFKQMVVRDYHPALRLLRPAFNVAAPLLRLPRLPQPGAVLAQGWLSHLAHPDADLGLVVDLVSAAVGRARARGLEQVLLGIADAHPARGALQRRLRSMRYRSVVYLVHRDDDGVQLPDTTRTLVHLETATI